MIVRAPGKIVILGEYAVVDGAPAIVRAVDRGVRCTVTPAERRSWSTPTGDDRFVRRALESVDAPPAHYAFEDDNAVPTDEKVGLGGSAAATVAAVVAAWRTAGREPPADEVFERAFAIHHEVQGSGSGIDVAASAHGGWIRFEGGRVVALPEGPPCAVVYTGRSASTGPRVQRYLALSEPVRRAFVDESRRVVDGFVADPVGAVRRGAGILRSMADRAGIAYWTDDIDVLVAIADDHGGAAKPSGAGGGDVVVALFDDDEARHSYVEAARARGYRPVSVRTASGAGTATGFGGR